MKKLKNLLLLGVMVLFIPTFVNAASLELGQKNVSANVATVPVTISLGDGETVAAIKGVYCSVDGYDSSDISCEISNVKDHILSLSGTETNGQKVATLTITNHKERSVNDVVATLKYETYTLQTNKIDLGPKPEERKASSNARLKEVTVSSGKISPEFSADKTDYVIYGIADTVKSIVFDYVCEDTNCNGATLEGGVQVNSMKVDLNIGENKVILTSKAEDNIGTAKYTFTVYRGETSYNSAKLKSLVIGEYELSPKFKPDVYEYTLSIPYSLVTLATAITYEAEDEKATVEIKGHDNLVVGENTISIKVTNVLDTETVEYKVVVTRLDDQDIIVKAYKDGKITFLDSNQEKKELTEEEFEKQYPAEWAKIKNKTYEFDEDGNIKVKEAEEDSKETKEEKKSSKTWLIVLLIVLGIAIIGVSGYFIFRKKPENKDGKKDSKKDEVEEKKEDNIEVKQIDDVNESDEDLLNLSDADEININIRRNPDADVDYNVETEIESVEHVAAKRNLDDTVDIDEALSDLMSTRQYNFTDEDEK